MAATKAGISVLALTSMIAGPPKGTPRLIFGNRAAMKPQNSSCTSSGVPRKNQMYSQLKLETSGLGRPPLFLARDQLVAPLITGWESAPDWIPHLERIEL